MIAASSPTQPPSTHPTIPLLRSRIDRLVIIPNHGSTFKRVDNFSFFFLTVFDLLTRGDNYRAFARAKFPLKNTRLRGKKHWKALVFDVWTCREYVRRSRKDRNSVVAKNSNFWFLGLGWISCCIQIYA